MFITNKYKLVSPKVKPNQTWNLLVCSNAIQFSCDTLPGSFNDLAVEEPTRMGLVLWKTESLNWKLARKLSYTRDRALIGPFILLKCLQGVAQ